MTTVLDTQPCAATSIPAITVGVTTRNRPQSLRRCLDSLRRLSPHLDQVIVLDDASDEPVEAGIVAEFGDALPLIVVRHATNLGYIVGRNRIVELSRTEGVLLLDDDTVVLAADVVVEAALTLQADASLAAVAFAQADADGQPWPSATQPAPVDYPCYAATFIGFAHLLRRDLFLGLGGYRELFHYYGEEKEYCLRALNAGCRVAYLPDCRIAHLPDPNGRDPLKYFRSYTRNDCLAALYTMPWPVAAARIALHLAFYQSTIRRHVGLCDPGGRRWLLRELRTAWTDVRRNRRAVRWQTLWQWRKIRREHPTYGH